MESLYAKSALRQLDQALYAGTMGCCSLSDFEEQTGLSLTDKAEFSR